MRVPWTVQWSDGKSEETDFDHTMKNFPYEKTSLYERIITPGKFQQEPGKFVETTPSAQLKGWTELWLVNTVVP